ncbi:Uncharacterised protein [Vibrio cholerae]|nr:Uncharacterised protein [Vibrio cholerae]
MQINNAALTCLFCWASLTAQVLAVSRLWLVVLRMRLRRLRSASRLLTG